ncbi:hypothetical protein BDZ97DRAFT_1341189 [Flammula alnicola]|nr:hypothetical protein BDZ97DRAFT_1341189 [Flammula alnicola]
MTTTAVYHPGLIFATLVVRFVTTKGAQMPALYARRRGQGEPESSSDGPESPSQTIASPTGSTTPSLPSNMTASSSLTSSGSATTISSTTSSTTSLIATPGSQINAPVTHRNITTGGIVGAAFGSVMIAGLALLLLAKCLSRMRKARKRPQELLPSKFLAPASSKPQPPVTEMSQTQSSPLISSAVAARVTTNAPPHYPHSVTTNTTNSTFTSLSLSPLIPAAGLNHPRSIASSSDHSASLSYTDASFGHEPLQSHYDLPPSSWGAHTIEAALERGAITSSLTGTSSSSTEPEASGLQRAMTAYQKALEAEDQKDSQVASTKQDDIQDPPPKYDA